RLFVAKSPQEFLDIRLEAADKSVTSAVNQTTKINQIATESMIKACDPIKTRMDNAMESFLA
ncbi:MAG TPA: phasin family protein, partial [Rhodospirillales bacterium]|nr:phasin family protein [Rhodospirillales bacterium]